MFSVMTVILFTGDCKRVQCQHYPWCIGPHCTGFPFPSPFQTVAMGICLGPSPTSSRHGTWESSDSDIWWPSQESISNLFTWGLPFHHQYWHLVVTKAHMVGKWVVCLSNCSKFLAGLSCKNFDRHSSRCVTNFFFFAKTHLRLFSSLILIFLWSNIKQNSTVISVVTMWKY